MVQVLTGDILFDLLQHVPVPATGGWAGPGHLQAALDAFRNKGAPPELEAAALSREVGSYALEYALMRPADRIDQGTLLKAVRVVRGKEWRA
jgi:hypothetical protein